MDKKEIQKLFRNYNKAEAALIDMRDKLFPAGTKVRSRINPEYIATVRNGSLYPHQINTDWGHMSWQCLEVVEE